LVTGGAGFIGSHLTEALVGAGHFVRVFDNLSTGKRDNLSSVQQQIESVQGDITDSQAVRRAVADCDWVFHLAALPSVVHSVEHPLSSHAVCATGTLNLLDAARRAKITRVVYAASSSAYGNAPGSIRDENDPLEPLSPYAAAKLAGEHYCQCFTATYGLETVRLRFFNIFGPRQDPSSPYTGVIAIFASVMLRGQPPRIDGDGLQSRDFTYVGNAVQALCKAAVAPAAVGNVFNIGNGVSVNILELVSSLNAILGTSIQPVFGPPRPGDVRHSQANISRARQDLDYDPKVSFLDGLRLTLAHQRQPT
jgi:UDP-glucose 4-epimerase